MTSKSYIQILRGKSFAVTSQTLRYRLSALWLTASIASIYASTTPALAQRATVGREETVHWLALYFNDTTFKFLSYEPTTKTLTVEELGTKTQDQIQLCSFQVSKARYFIIPAWYEGSATGHLGVNFDLVQYKAVESNGTSRTYTGTVGFIFPSPTMPLVTEADPSGGGNVRIVPGEIERQTAILRNDVNHPSKRLLKALQNLHLIECRSEQRSPFE